MRIETKTTMDVVLIVDAKLPVSKTEPCPEVWSTFTSISNLHRACVLGTIHASRHELVITFCPSKYGWLWPPKFGRLRLDDGPETWRSLPGMDSRDWFLAYISLVEMGSPSRVVSRRECLGEKAIRPTGGESYAQPAYE